MSSLWYKFRFPKSTEMEIEEKQWTCHELITDGDEKARSKVLIENFEEGEKLKICYVLMTSPFHYEHWFITIKDCVLDFYSKTENDIYKAFYGVQQRPTYRKYHDPDGTDMNVHSEMYWGPEMNYRLKQVLGMGNYSHCLRNSEHVVNYITTGFWFSKQMVKDKGILYNRFGKALSKEKKLYLINSLPIDILSVTPTPVYSFTAQHFQADQVVHYLENSTKSHNILVVGPTGSGKSHLINVMFNTLVCATNMGHGSVTTNMCFVVGKGDIHNRATHEVENKEVVVADTNGLDDILCNDKLILNLIKDKAASNFQKLDLVLVVFSAARLTQQWVKNIRKMLAWLNYDENYRRVYFIATHSEHLDKEETQRMAESAKNILGIKRSKSLIYTAFPPEESLNDLTKSKCHDSWIALRRIICNNPHVSRISIQPYPNSCATQ